MEWLSVLGGYISVQLASLLNRKQWPEYLKFLVALGIAVGIAFGVVWVADDPMNKMNVLAALGVSFGAQQTTFHLRVPGAGSESINTVLENVPVLPE
jgi:hypothetical protein